MTSARHRQVVEQLRRRPVQGIALATVVAVLAVVALVTHDATRRAPAQRGAEAASVAPRLALTDRGAGDSPYRQDRLREFSRSAQRVTLKPKPKPKPKPKAAPKPAPKPQPKPAPEPEPKVVGHRYLTAPLNLWTAPRERGRPLTVLASGGRVDVTGAREAGFAQILRAGRLRWVNARYLVVDKPTAAPSRSSSSSSAAAPAGGVLSSAPCASGSGIESGIVAQAVVVHRAVCAHFPQVRTYGGWRPDGEHADGHAIDIMVYADHATGQAIADWLRANASILHVDDVIWSQHIWTTQRASEGWRLMPDRGSTTANHYDHVHVRVF